MLAYLLDCFGIKQIDKIQCAMLVLFLHETCYDSCFYAISTYLSLKHELRVKILSKALRHTNIFHWHYSKSKSVFLLQFRASAKLPKPVLKDANLLKYFLNFAQNSVYFAQLTIQTCPTLPKTLPLAKLIFKMSPTTNCKKLL